MTTSTTTKDPRGDVTGLRKWLRSSSAYYMLDDSVLGCLETADVECLLEDYGIRPTDRAMNWFARELDAALREGC